MLIHDLTFVAVIKDFTAHERARQIAVTVEKTDKRALFRVPFRALQVAAKLHALAQPLRS
jgi:hypothetical protein